MEPLAVPSEAWSRLVESVGEAFCRTDVLTRRRYSQDVYRAGSLAAAVVSPKDREQVAQIVKIANEYGIDLFVRGGGMSYTDAYLPTSERSVVVDLRRMNRIRELNTTDLYVTAEAGCTWAELDTALAAHGLRSIFWGPMSGRLATIGGGMSQGAATFGSGRHGTSANAALAFEIVTGNGELLQTGSGAQPNHSPFFRHYGPDLTGLFTGDAGAFGIKTAVTLALEVRPACGAGLSFSFEQFGQLVAALQIVAKYGLATEVFGAETALLRSVAGPANLGQDARTALTVFRSADNPLRGLWQVLRMARHGRSFLQTSHYTVSILTEATDRGRLAANLRDIREAVAPFGSEIPNTMAAVTRATPFPDPMVLGPAGKRLLPLHAILPYSRIERLHQAFGELLGAVQGDLSRLGIDVFVVYATLGSNAVLYEPVIYWQDEWPELHRATVQPSILSQFTEPPPNIEARARVERLRCEIIELMHAHGASHLQIGRAYPYARNRNAAALQLVGTIRSQIDPHSRVNPGALGLTAP